VKAVLDWLDGMEGLVARLLNGGGLRLMESLRLRVKDLDFEKLQVTVHSGKGDKDRRTMLPHLLRALGSPSAGGAKDPSAGPGCGLGEGGTAACTGSQIPKRCS
jgi:integrase